MPRYRYGCRKCGRAGEEIHQMGEQPRTVACPCGGRMDRVFSAPQVIPDDFGKVITLTSVKSADHPARSPRVSSMSELRREVARSNARYGTDLELV